ncbi:glycoside hydrolase family 3 N-terminal domain-containing protein [Methyloceanibacter sp.]|uniref:glycoside hydrolase family 3 N-terminal domain-containing protein n=1 Tax=Methyloceanibacter sp. TaxID=1965321 RepID=UPI003D6CD00D
MKRPLILLCFWLLAAGRFAFGAPLLNAAEPDSLASLRETAEADDLLDRMIGQTIMVGFSGQNEHDPGVKAVRDELAKGLIGGVVLYPDNIRSARQLRLLTAYLLNANSELVPFIAVDQEGGRVQRLTKGTGHKHYPSAEKMGRDATLTPEEARRIYGEMAKELAGVGINVNFGPVVDLSVNPWNAVIARRKRSYGADPKTVTSLARSFIAAHREANVVTVAKHFPGHGSSFSDSHKTLPDISRTWRESELQPYVALSHDGLLDMVMVGHLYHPRFSDGEMLPSSLSANAIRALRGDGYIGYQGVVVSDDMEMGAVRERYSVEDRVIRALDAGVDLLVFSNVNSRDTGLGAKVYAIIAQAVHDGRIPRAKIEAAYGRIAALKHRLMAHELSSKD